MWGSGSYAGAGGGDGGLGGTVKKLGARSLATTLILDCDPPLRRTCRSSPSRMGRRGMMARLQARGTPQEAGRRRPKVARGGEREARWREWRVTTRAPIRRSGETV